MRSIALAIAAVLLLASCSDDPEPIEPKTSASGIPTEPVLPDSAREDSPGGAANFVDYWVSAFNYGAQTGNVELMLSHAGECKPCKGYAKDFRQLAPSNRAKEPVWRLSNVSVSANRDPIEVEADVEIANEQDPSTLVFVLNDQAPFELTDIYKSQS
jgi:thiol-disulfide isomerase/thioredoxin